MRTFKYLATILVTAAFSMPSAAQTDPSKLVEYTLDNGLDVMLRRVDGGKQITVMTLFDFGDKHDPAGQSGIAHLMEHLYITCATDETEATTAAEWAAKYNNQVNAQTGEDYTLFATTIEIGQLPAELKRHAARMNSLKITQADLERERPRVYEELNNMYKGIATLAARNVARSYVDPAAAGARRGGQQADIEKLTLDDLKQWYTNYYRPNNVTLLVVGEFDASAISEIIVQEFLPISSGQAIPEARSAETKKLGQTISVKTTELASKGQLGVAVLAYRAPDPSDPDYGPFLLMAPRIYQRALEDGAKWSEQTAPVTYGVLDDPGGIYITRSIYEGEDLEHAAVRMRTYVEWARTFEVNMPVDRSPFQYDLATQLAVVRMPDTAVKLHTYGEALRIGRFKQLGLSSDEIRKQIMRTTPKSMNEAGKRLFSMDNSIVVIVTPERTSR